MLPEEIVSSFEFVGNSIKELCIENDFINFDNNDENIEKTVDVNYAIDQIASPVSSEDESVMGVMTLQTQVNMKGAEKQSSIHLTVEGCFCSPKGTNIDAFKELLVMNGCMVLYSISRSIIISISSQMFTNGSVVLPMINVYELQRSKNAFESQEKNGEKTAKSPEE